MATVDKQSIRDEFDKIKPSFQKQVTAGKVSTEVTMLFNVLWKKPLRRPQPIRVYPRHKQQKMTHL